MAATIEDAARAMRAGMAEAAQRAAKARECEHRNQVATAAGDPLACTDCGASLNIEWRDAVNHPAHYTSDPSGVECITITRHRNFNVGNAIKYLWRAGLKSSDPNPRVRVKKQIEDLRKAIWYINDEIERLAAQRENA